jgi:hypothetical protein
LPRISEFPGLDAEITDRTKQRRPKFTTAIFRNYPARAQSYAAENLEKEGWFDDKGWLITDWFVHEDASGNRKDRFQNGEDPIVGGGTQWASNAWHRAFDMWKKHGEASKLYLSAREQENYEKESEFFRNEYNAQTFLPPVPLDPNREQRRTSEDRDRMVRSHHAFSYMYWYKHYQTLTNFDHFYLRSQTELDEKTIHARKAFFEARQLNRLGKRLEALEKYETPPAPGMPATLTYWRDLLFNERFGNDSQTEDDSYVIQLRYLRLMQETKGQDFKQVQAIQAFLGESAACASPSWLTLGQLFRPHLTPQPEITGPFDGETKNGHPIISPETRTSVHTRFGIGIKPLPPGPPQRIEPVPPTVAPNP